MEDHVATKAHQSAHQSVDADRFARSKDEQSGWQHVAALADSSGDVLAVTLTVDGVIETWKQSAERLDGHAQAA
jgi:hypothetical protein